MPTKLSKFCDGVIEAAWLAAVILIPIYFNIYSSRIFEPDKIAILRSLAVVILVSWLIKLIEQGGFRWVHIDSESSFLGSLTRIPLIAPVIILAIVYLIATIFSVTPRISLWGSYQRLQGTYTTFSYLVIFLAIVGNLRKKSQIERLITTIVLASLPVSLYGILQRYQIDPIPWGGDTSRRIAANMGNSIFIAAYLIMVFPLTVGRIVQSFSAILTSEQNIWAQMARSTIYVFIAAVQLLALYMSGSRGPALGWLAGSFFLLVLLSLYWRKRWLTIGIISIAVILGVFLLIFNLPEGPLDGLRNSSVIGRYGLLLDAESNSALVRKYIWQGAADLVAPHEPLEFPDGSKDPFNALRMLIGYGPESMYVAYNPFYVPELAQVERRNASPDRSHNESWDALVITGVTGLLTYLALFSLIFYYGLKWVGLITNQNQRNLFLVLMLGGGIVGALGFGFWRGVEYFGVGLPFGMLIGFLAYLTSTALFSRVDQIPGGGKTFYAITLIGVIAGIVSHFVEINFGIAIASTRIYFWVYTALLVCVGYFIPRYHETDSDVDQDSLDEIILPRKKRRSKSADRLDREDYVRSIQDWFPAAFIIAITMIGLGYDFITNPNGLKNFYSVLWEALTRLPNRGGAISYGILAVIVTSWLMMSLVYAVEGASEKTDKSIWRVFILILLISGAFTLVYWIWHANSLAIIARSVASTVGGVLEQVKRYEGLITKFYIFLFFGVLVLGYSLGGSNSIKLRYVKVTSILSVTLGLIFAIFLVAYTNIRVIQADIAFKLADPFTSGDQWPIAIQIYNRANLLAPNEDYYYLFLGRAYLEYAKLIPEPVQRESLIKQAEADLREAQTINPLNTDHTANLARLYNLWSTLNPDTENRLAKAKISTDYFSKAVVLSPKNARLWDEWALLYLNVLNQPKEAYERLKKAQEIDPNYHWTYALIGEYYSQQAREAPEQAERNQFFKEASEAYTRALELPTPGDVQSKYNYALALGAIYIQLDMSQDAIAAYKQAIELAPQNVSIWRVDEALSSLYAQVGDLENALLHLNNALQLAPEDQKERLNDVLRHIQPD